MSATPQMTMDQLIQQLSPNALAFVTRLIEQGDKATLDLILEIANQAGIQAVEDAIQEFLAQDPSMGGGQPGGAPQGGLPDDTAQQVPLPGLPDDSQMPPLGGALPGGPAGAPLPGLPDDSAGMPPGMPPMDPNVMPPGMPGMGMAPPGMPPMQAPPGQSPQGTVGMDAYQQRAPQKKKKIPKYNLPPLKKVTAPTLDDILEDARRGREFWQPRDQRIREDYELYHLTYDTSLFGDRANTTIGGTIVHRRSQPNTLVNLVTSLTTPKNDQLIVELEPRADDSDHRDAAQHSEDFVLYSRECDEEYWLESRVAEPPLRRKEAGLAALEGGFGWTWYVDPDNEDHPIQYELCPLSQLYDIGSACTRQYTVPLHRARREWEKIKEAYPKGGHWDPNQLVRIIIHIDNDGIHRSVVWEDAGKPAYGRGADNGSGFAPSRPGGKPTSYDEDRQWIQKPERINFGFKGYNYVTWGGTPAELLDGQQQSNIALKGHGVLTMLRKTFRLMDLFISAVATGALQAVDPAIVAYSDSPDLLSVQRPDRRPHGFTAYPKDTKIEPLVWEVSRNADAMNLMNSLIAELSDVQSPALSGVPGPSGVAQQINTEQASEQVIGPIIDAMEQWYGLQHKQRLILALRYSDDKDNKDNDGEEQTYFAKYTRRSYREPNFGEYGELKPKDIYLSGVRVKVRYHNKNTQEEMAISQMVQGLTQAHLMSQETALRRMGVKDPQRELQRILADGAFMEPAVLKALIETAVYNSGDPVLIAAWQKAFLADAMKGAGGSPQPAQPGVASLPGPANQPGMNMQGTSSAMQAPGQQQMGMMAP